MKTLILPTAGALNRTVVFALAVFTSSALAARASGDEHSFTAAPDTPTASGTASVPAEFQAASAVRTTFKPAYTRKYGTPMNDMLAGIASDNLGNAYIAGNSTDWEPNGFLRKHSPEGKLLWTKIKPKVSVDGVTVDKTGNVYIAGSYSTGTMLATRHFIYLEKFDTDGNPLWIKTFRAAAASDPTRMTVNGIGTDPSGKGFIILLFERTFWPYQTTQVFIRKYNSSGVPIWEKPAGGSTPYTPRPILAVDRFGRAHVAMNSAANRRWNTSISRFDSQGDPVWTTSFAATSLTEETFVHAIASDRNGNLFVAGITKANLEGWNSGFYDAFLRKYDNTGAVLWTRQFGTAANDYANSLATDAAGNVHLAGSSSGALGTHNRGSFDAVTRVYGGKGKLLRSKQFGTAEFDIAYRIALDALGNLYVAGHTLGNIGGSNKGGQDVYLRKFSVSP